MSKRLIIIDGKSVFYRGYYAMPNLSTKDGTPTGGVYGFAVMALEVIKRLKPDYVCVAWDKAKTNIRSRRDLYPAYKANRKAAPPDFYEQIPLLIDLLNSLGWPLYELDDYEADDIMGAFAKQAGEQDVESFLVTSDLDVLQLVNTHTHIYTLKKGLSNIELFDVAHFEEKYGVGAHQWVDVKALKGDSSDNIPGVAGVGEKTALELIKKYDTLDGVYQHLDEQKPALQTKLQAGKDMAYLSKKLVTLMVDAPIKINLDDAKLRDGATPEFAAMLRKLEFRNLLRQVESQLSAKELAEAETASGTAVTPAMRTGFVAKNYAGNTPRVVATNLAQTELWVSSKPGVFSVIQLAENTTDEEFTDPTKGVQTSLLGNAAEQPTVKPAEQPANVVFGLQAATQALAGPLVGHDLKPTLLKLMDYGFAGQVNVAHDTCVGAFLLNSLERSLQLDDLLQTTLDHDDPGTIIAAIWHAYGDQQTQFGELDDLSRLAKTVDFPMVQLLAVMEHRGIHLDSKYLGNMSGKFAQRITEFEQKIYDLAGQQFNIGSPAQLGTILFEKLGLPTQGIKKGKTGYSTGASELDKLRGLSPIVDLITYYREYTKLKSTYIDALPKLVDDQGKLHTTFNQDVAATGRLSSTNPNLQNIPTRTEIGQAIRTAFVPAKGNVFVSADYSQFELRLAAVLAGDQKMIDDFNQDIDIHLATAAEVYGVPLEQVDKLMRRRAKVVNFGVLYGMSPHGLSVATGMTRDEAKNFIDRYFELRADVRAYIDQTVKDAEQNGFVATLFGRRRPTPDLKSSNFIIREAAKRAAANMPIQGTEADLMKMAMLKAEQRLEGLGQQLLQIHDSILVECPAKNAQKVADILRDTMEHIYKLPVKLKVDVTTGNNWGEL